MSPAFRRASRCLLLALLVCPVRQAYQTNGHGAWPLDVETLDAAELRNSIESGHLADLHCPNFAAYRTELKAFYLHLEYRPAWVKSGEATPQALSVVHLFQHADEKGLVADDYDALRWTERLQKLHAAPSDPETARFDLGVTVSLIRYVHDLHFGRANPNVVSLSFDVDGRKYELEEFLRERVIHAANPEGALAAVEPQFPGYWKALELLRAYKQMATRDEPERLPVPAKPVAPGRNYPGVGRLARLLRLIGDLPTDAQTSSGSDAYEGDLVEAVKRFQQRHGQTADAVIDSDLVKALNAPLAQRVRQLTLILERWRWLSPPSSRARIIVNLPEFTLYAIDADNRVALRRKVIVGGSHGHRSPIFEKEMKQVVFRPYWDVPPSIQLREIVPHVEEDRDYIAKKGFEVVTPEGVVVTDGTVNNDILARLKARTLHVRQKPGPMNSLGLVKFVFPNEQSVYMHDTDAPKLFSRERRDLSHGCIRVEGAADLAAWVLRRNSGWDRDRVVAAMNSEHDNFAVQLVQSVTVEILYGTVAIDEEGKVSFFDDCYGYDAELEVALAGGS